jgi:hypothetical protein
MPNMAVRRRIGLSVVSIATIAVAVFAGAQLAPAAERGEFGDESRASALEFVGQATQDGASISIVGYVTRIAGIADADLFATTNPLARNENTARITFSASTTISQSFVVVPQNPTMFDVNSAGSLTFFFTDAPAPRSFGTPGSFSSGTPVATNSVRFQDVVAALGGIDPTRGVVDGNGELCQTSATSFRIGGENRRLGKSGTQSTIFTHGWTTRTSPKPQSQTQFGGHTTVLGDSRC